MEKKYKISDFADLIGVTAKTVYKMIEREEIKTVNEKVNGREIKLVVASDEQINKLNYNNSQNIVNNRNYEDMLTDNNNSMKINNYSQSNNNNLSMSEMFDKIMEVNQEYNDRIKTLNEELIDSKSKLLLLEDKANREGLYIAEIKELKTEKNSKQKVINFLLSVIVLLIISLTVIITVNLVSKQDNENQSIKKEPSPQVEVQNVKKAHTK